MDTLEAKEIIKNIQPNRKAYNRMEYILSVYCDLKKGSEIIDAPRNIIKLIDEAIELIADDPYIELLELIYKDGKTIREIAHITNYEERTIYRHKKRLIKRLAVILYGDEALKE